jgi:hypothetical protein
MSKFKLLKPLGILAIAVSALSVRADLLIDDFEGGTNENAVGDYWYFYSDDDAANKGKSKVNNAEKNAKGELVFKGSYGATSTPTAYDAGADGSMFSGVCDFTLGDTAGMALYVKPFVGMGTNLAADPAPGAPLSSWIPFDATGATGIEFAAKADFDATIEIKLETKPVAIQDGTAKYDHFQATFTVQKGEWSNFSKAIPGDFNQVLWSKKKVPFDIKQLTKIAFQISYDNVMTTPRAGKLYIDNLKFTGDIVWRQPDSWKPSAINPPSDATKGKLSKFDDPDAPTENTLGKEYYWYAYTDEKDRATAENPGTTSSIDKGVDTKMGLVPKDGAVEIVYTLGTLYKDANNVAIKPFVGIGTNLFNDIDLTNYTDGSNISKIYFEYKTEGDCKIRVEVEDSLDAKKLRKSGASHYRVVDGSAEWTAASIPIDSLVIPKWAKTEVPEAMQALVKSKLSKIQFRAMGSAEKPGTMYIRNVWLDGLTTKTLPIAPKYRVKGITTDYSKGILNFKYNSAYTNGVVSIINLKGAVLATKKIGSSADEKITLGKLLPGVYFVRFTGIDANGKNLVHTMPVRYLK